MSTFVIWVDHEHSRIFHSSGAKLERSRVDSRVPEHHSHSKDNLARERDSKRMFKDVAARMKGAEQVLILGPGLAKQSLKAYLEEHAPLVAEKIVGCETVDHPSDPQILEFAERFFRRQELAPAAE